MSEVRLALLAMRARFELILRGPDEGRLRSAGEEALREIEQAERLLNPHDPASDIARINAQAGQGPVRVAAPTWQFLCRATELTRASDGAFDPSAGSAEGGLESLLVLDDALLSARLTHGKARLDPGAIGKGWALERAEGILRDAGVSSALLHGGTSTVVAIGSPAGEPGWRVAVADPRAPGEILHCVSLRDEALSVSAIHERPHVLDPRTGQPVAHTLLATVRTASATDADALSTALLVLGERGGSLQERFPQASFWRLSAGPSAPQ